jgi:hypothetical protein
MTSFWRRSTWTPLGRPLLLRCSTPALRHQLLSCRFPHRPDRPTATTTTTRIRTTIIAMAATAARTVVVVVAVVVTLAPPWPPLDPPAITVGPLLHGRRIQPMAGTHHHVPQPSTYRTVAAAGFHGCARSLHAPRIHSWAAEAATVPIGRTWTFSRLDI